MMTVHEGFQGDAFPDLRVLYPDELQLLFDSAERITFKANEPVIKEGQQGKFLYLVRSGQLLVNKRHGDSVYEVGSITQGDMFGEASLLHQSTADAEVRAVDDCELYAVPAETVRILFDSNERFLKATTQLAERRSAASALAVNPVFSTLPMAVREVALYNAQYMKMKEGEVVIHEGTEASLVFVILSGSVEVSFRNPRKPDSKIVVAKRSSGDELGDISVLTGKPHSATVIAIEPVRVLALRNICISAWISRYSDFAYALYGQVYQKLKENRSVLNTILDDREARSLTIGVLPSLEEYKFKHHL